MFAVVFVT